MSILYRVLTILLLLALPSCIGHRSSINPEGLAYKNGDAHMDDVLNRVLIGRTRDNLILHYGLPNRTAKLDNGLKLMQYNRKRKWISENGLKYNLNCELRLWMMDNKVHSVDYLGDEEDCLRFLVNARHDVVQDDRNLR